MDVIRFRLSHLKEMIEFSKAELSEEAAKYSEIRVVETVDAVFDEQQWSRTKSNFQSFIKDFPDLIGIWRIYDGQEARQVILDPRNCINVTGNADRIILEIRAARHFRCDYRACWSYLAISLRDCSIREPSGQTSKQIKH